MDQTVKFTPLDMQTWPRGQMFYYFSKMAPTGYSLTVDLDVTAMRTALKHAGIKFFPAYLWLVTRTLQMQKEFKIAELDGQVGCFDTLTPLYAAFHEDDKTFSFMWTEYTDDFMAFYQSYLDNQRRYGGSHGVLAQAGQTPPANAYTISCVPWVSFKRRLTDTISIAFWKPCSPKRRHLQRMFLISSFSEAISSLPQTVQCRRPVRLPPHTRSGKCVQIQTHRTGTGRR